MIKLSKCVFIVIFGLLETAVFSQEVKKNIEDSIRLLIDYQTNHCYEVPYWDVMEKIAFEGVGEGFIDVEKLSFFASRKELGNEVTPFPRVNIFVGTPKLTDIYTSTESYRLNGKEFNSELVYFAKVQYNVVGNWNYVDDQGESSVFPGPQLVTTYYIFLEDPNGGPYKLMEIFRPNARGHAFPIYRSLKEVVKAKRPEMEKMFVTQLSKQFATFLIH